MKLSVVIPAFNEEKRLEPFLRAALPWLERKYGDEVEVIVVDDGSRDRTAEVAAKLVGETAVVRLPANRGKGAAVREGMRRAKGKLRLFVDADGATPISELERLIPAIDSGADVAIGSRAAFGGRRVWARGREGTGEEPGGPPQWHVRWHRHVTGRAFSRLVRWLTGLSIRDTQCGFKLLTADAAERLFALAAVDRFAFDVELLYLASRLHLRTVEIAVHWHEVSGSKVRLLRDSWQMFRELLKIRRRHRRVHPSSPPRIEKRGLKEKRRA